MAFLFHLSFTQLLQAFSVEALIFHKVASAESLALPLRSPFIALMLEPSRWMGLVESRPIACLRPLHLPCVSLLESETTDGDSYHVVTSVIRSIKVFIVSVSVLPVRLRLVGMNGGTFGCKLVRGMGGFT